MRQTTIIRIEQEKIIAILRGIGRSECRHVADALFAGGMRLLEITFDQSGAAAAEETAAAISEIAKAYGENLLVGAGTVLTTEQVELAARAGARFIISPDVNPEVIQRTKERNMVSIPGVLTPTEILTAHRSGADFAKIFPAGNLGSAYMKAVCAPISHVKLLAVGGVNEKNIGEFLAAGAVGAGIGGNLVNRTWIQEGAYEKITETARALVAAVKHAR